MHAYRIPIWKTSPFSRLIIPLMFGIILQWNRQFQLSLLLVSFGCFTSAFFLFYFIPLELKYRYQYLQGILLFLIISAFSMIITSQKDTRNHHAWFGNYYTDSSSLIIRINEPLVEKLKSYKAEGYVETVINKDKIIPAKGKLVVYFLKDSAAAMLHYGDRIIIKKPLQPIKNSGNPGAFNYERYSAFQQTFHNVYLGPNDWQVFPGKNTDPLKLFIFFIRSHIVNVLQKNIGGDKNSLGIAEALLIGYKEDLDKDLVQAYSNAGVVHIIAISGLHLGLIYVLLAWIFTRLPFIKKMKVLRVILILSCLWLFSLITGASASVLRSAVMFTCIVIGKNFFKQTAIYNSLATSAFILLCYDPYFLWDVGFQLSYLAVIGIVALQKPIENLIYIKNKQINKVWNMLAITIAAQVTTFPICIYYFHQFPNYFFITNLLAVPLSTIILFVEIFLIAFSWLQPVAVYAGKLTGWLVWIMNEIIRFCNNLPFSLIDNIYADLFTTCLLYAFVICICRWKIIKEKLFLRFALFSLFGFTVMQTCTKLKLRNQRKMIIYNIPRQQAVDFIFQNKYFFYGDTLLLKDGLLKNFHLKPARIALQADRFENILPGLYHKNNLWYFFNKKIIIIDSSIRFVPLTPLIKADVLLISKNPIIKISAITTAVAPSIIVFDASNSLWKIAQWKKECLVLALPCFSIPEQGAFFLNAD